MTAMLKPPVQMVRDLGWAQVLGFGQADDQFWAGVRGRQLAELSANIPFNLALLLLNVVPVLAAFGGRVPFAQLAPALAGMAGLALMWSLRAARRRHSGAPATASRQRFWRVTAELAALGLCWAVMVAVMLPVLPADEQTVLMMFSFIMLGAMSNAAITMPVAVAVIACGIGLVMWLSVPVGAPLDQPMIALVLGSFVAIKLRAATVATYHTMARLKSEADLGEQGEVVRLLLNEYEANGSDWLLELDGQGRLTHVTARFADVARRKRGDLLGQPLLSLIDPAQGGAACAALVQALRDGEAFRDLMVPVPLGRDLRWWALSGTPKQDMAGHFTGFRGVGRDVTEMRRSQERIAQLARFDPLTGLANRSLFREMLDETLEQAERGATPAALLFVDLDRFKAVNDGFGHAAGDLLLRQVAQRLQALMKGHDRGGATIARLGGDEFAILLQDGSGDRPERLARRIVREMARPFALRDQARGDQGRGGVVVGASVGWALAPEDANTPEALLKCADLALYQVKGEGRGAACRFSAEMAAAAEQRRKLEADLASALDRDQLRLLFQPVVDAADERITGFEALLRWHHPELGLIPPLNFIPVAEETGLIVPIGHWVIDQALGWAALWPDHVRVAVNLSAVQMDDADLPGLIQAGLLRHGVAADRLELEITESLFLAEKPAVQQVLAALTALGINFALDDFGTGYSALGTLQKASFSRIKIDRSFVKRATAMGDEASAIIQAIVRLAASLDMATTAEGTETRAAFELCRDLGCTQVQGFLFGKPMPPEQATALVAQMAAA